LASVFRIGAATLLLSAATSFAAQTRAAETTTAECLSASEKSIKLRQEIRLREARQQLLVCAASQCPSEVQSECERRFVEVNSSIPTLVFEAKDSAGTDLSAVTVTMDGKPLVGRLDGTALPLDPGMHAFRFETAGHAAVEKSFLLLVGEKELREGIVFGLSTGTVPLSTAAEAPGDKGDARGVPPPAVMDRGATSSFWGPLKTMGVIVGGVGIVGIGVGTAFGLLASTDKNNANCDAQRQCVGSLSDAHTHANVSTAAFVAGGVMLATGAGLVIFGPIGSVRRMAVTPTAGTQGGGIVLGGAF
jgi:hypothetical protein